MAAQISSETECGPMEGNSPSKVGFDEEVIAQGSLDFDEWTSLISNIENSFPDDLEKISLVYDSFLAEFPLCYGYWMKYANHKARLGNVDKVVHVFERAVQSATYSVHVWFHYCNFSISAFEDPHAIRRLFKRALSFVGKDYLSHTLWDKYLEFEFSQQQWSSLAHIYIQTLKFPSKKLHRYYDSFKKLAAAWKGELDCQNDSRESQLNLGLESGVPAYYRDVEISSVIKDLLEPSVRSARSKAVQKYLVIGEHIYKEACQLDEKIHCFETRIRRPYFHVKPLDWSQLENWHDYLNFAEKQEDFDWAVKLYERCLIPCANYPEFWMRYVDFMESKGGREIANFALARATQIFLKRTSFLHLFKARYKEQIGDVSAARAAFLECDNKSDSSFIENVTTKANMEKRLGNFLAACKIYKEAIDTAAEKKKLHTLPILYVHFSQLKYMTTDSADAARDILIDGIRHVPDSRLLLEELIKFAMMQGGSRHMNVVDSVIADALYSGPDAFGGFSLEDAEDISRFYLQFVDLCGTIHDVRKAWNRHIKYFPHSLRAAIEHPPRSTKPLKSVMEVRQENPLPPSQSVPHHSTHSPSEDKKLSPPENYDIQSDPAATALLSDQKSPLLQNHDIQSDSAIVDHPQSGEADNRLQEEMQDVSHEVTEQHIEDSCEPNASSVDLVHRIANETEAEASQELCKEDNVPQECEHKQKQDLKPLSLEGLTLDPWDNQSPGSNGAISLEHEAHQEIKLSRESTSKSEALEETSMSNGSMPEDSQITKESHSFPSPTRAQVSDSAQIQSGSVSPSSVHHQNFMIEGHSQPQTPQNGGRNRHQKHNSDKFRRDSRFGFRGHSLKRLNQPHRASPQPYPCADAHAQKPMSSNSPSQPLSLQNPQIQQGRQAQTQYPASANLTSPQTWPMQNLHQQNLSFACQSQLPAQPVAYAQPQMSQFPSQSNEQHGHPQNNQMYNQMWQYYYYQQQQQQQFLMQQQHLQQLHQQPHQQQLVQQQYQSQYNFQQLHLQQQQFLPQQQQPCPQHQHPLYLQNQQVQQPEEQQQQQLPPQQLQEAQNERYPE